LQARQGCLSCRGESQVGEEIDLGDPNPWPFIRVWLYDHPPLVDRVLFALTYDPWSNGQSPKYVK